MPNDPLLPGASEAQAALDAAAATTNGAPTNLNPTSNFSQNSQSYFNDLVNQVNTLKQNLQSALTTSEYNSAAKPTVDSILALPAETNALNPANGSGQKIIFKGGNQADLLNLGTGSGGGGHNIIDGGNQSDTVYGKTRDVLVGANQGDFLLTQLGGSFIDGGNGNDNIVIGGTGSIAVTANGDDTVNASRGEHNIIDTGNGNDLVYLGKNDIALLGNGDDVVHMSGGGNIVQGGNGDDTFHIATGKVPDASSTILDFKPNDDKLSIESVPGINSFADISLVQSGANTLVKFGSNELVVLKNVLVSNLDANDFLIVPGGNNNDTTAPTISAALQSDTGASANDGITTIPAVTGTVVDQSAIASFRAGFDSAPVANFVSVLDVLNNNGSFLLDTARINSIAGGSLSAGTHTLHLIATDSAGNTSNVFNLTFQFVIDNSAPEVSVALLNDTGIAGDNKTTDATITGSVSEANQISSLKASLNNANVASFVDITNLIGAGGAFTLNSATLQSLNGGQPVAQGQNILRLQSTDEYGNVSSVVSFSFVYVVDNAAPSLSVGLINDNGIGNADLRTTDPRVSGLVQDSNVITSLKASVNDSNPVNMTDITSFIQSNGAFELDVTTLEQLNGGPLMPGQVTVRLRATDEFGNASSVLEFSFEYVIDNDAPEIEVALSADSGSSGSNKITNDPRISGSVSDANAVTQLLASLNDVSAAALVNVTALIDANGNFQFDHATLETLNGGPLNDGTQTLRIKAQDEFGNISDLTLFTFELDSVAPTVNVELQSDNGANSGDGKTSDPTIAGSVSDTHAVVSLKASLNNANAAAMQSILHLVDSSGNFVLDAAALETLNGNAALIQGENTLRIVSTDAAGNESTVTAFTFVFDTTGPELNAALANDTGVANDGITTNPTITGSITDQNAFGALYASVNNANPLAFVDVSSQVNSGDGSFTLSRSLLETIYGSSLPAGAIDIRLKATDEFGNITLRTVSFEYVVDQTAPLLTADLQNDTGRSGNDNVSVDPTIAGTVSDETQFAQLLAGVDSMTPGSYVDVTAHVDSNGNYVLDQATLEAINGGILTRGVHTVHLIARDAAGNETPVDFSFNFNRPFEVFPGARVRLDLNNYFAGTDNSTQFTVDTTGPLPTGEMRLNGRIEFAPTINEYGLYEFVVSARDGNTVTSQEFAINVLHDPITTTRITGRLVDLDWEPVHGVDVEFNGDHVLSDEDGRFTLVVTGPITDDVITFNELIEYDENGEIEEIYAYLAQKINVLLGHPVWEGVNNIISRVEYLPELDVENGHVIDPTQDQVITTADIPGVRLEFGAHTLLDTDGTFYDELLTITEMPVDQMPISRPPNLYPDLVIAIQPERLTFTTPAQLIMPDRTNNKVGTKFDLWAIDPIIGDFIKVGEGEKMSDGLVHTTSGGITTTDWSFFVPRPEQSGKGADPSSSIRNDKPICSCDQCSGGTNTPTNGNSAGIPGNSVVNSMTGEFLESHQLVGYQSLGESRTLTLTYGSTRANPEQLFHIPFENAVFGVLGDSRTRFVAEMWIQDGNFKHELPGFINAEGNDTGLHFWRINTSASDAVAKIDMREYETGYYDIGVRNGFMITTPDGTINGSATEFSDKILNVNMVGSVFGAGWGLNGLQQIFENSDGSILIVDGNGTQQLFRAPLTVGGEYQGSGHDFSTMIRRPDGTFFRTLTDGTEMAFNEFNMLATITDSNNNTLEFNYDANGRLIGLTDAAGLETQFNYTGERISSIVDPFGRATELIHDAAGNLIGIKDPDGDTTQYDYDDKRLLTEVTDKREMSTQIFYNAAGRADREILRDGVELKFDGLQAQGYLDYEKTFDPNLAPTINFILSGDIPVEGEDNFRVVNYKDGNGNQVSQAIDHEGRYVASRDSISSNLQVISSRVYTNGLVTRTYDGRGNFTDYTYDDRGNVLTISDSLSSSSSDIINYYDVTGFGNLIPGVSNTQSSAASLINLPFDFEFYGQSFDSIGVSNHGLLSFGGVNSNFDNVDLNSPGAAAALSNLPSILPFWDAFQTGSSSFTSRVYTGTTGDEGSRRFIIQWQQVIQAGTQFEDVLYDFEVVLHEGSNAIDFNYKNATGDGDHSRGRGATIGIFNSATEFQQFSFNTSVLDNGQVLTASESGIGAKPAPTGTGAKTFTYESTFNRVTSITDELGHQTLFDIDPTNGNVLKMTRVVGALGGDDDVVTEYSYNSHGQLTQLKDPEGRITEYTYNSIGRVTFVTEAKNTADERTTGYEYDLFGNVSAIIDPRNNRTEYEYDSMNRLKVLRRSDPDGLGPLESPETFFEYDDEGNLENFTDAEGRQTFFQYDEVGRMIEITDPLSQHRSYEYDNNGNLTKITDELGRETQNFYDARNRLTKTIYDNGLQRQFVYDTADNLTDIIETGIGQQHFSYDARDRMTNSVSVANESILYTYDAADRLVRTRQDAGFNGIIHDTRYEYDDLDRLIYTQNQLGGFSHFSYDKLGNQTSITNPVGKQTQYLYDFLDRLSNMIDSAGGLTSYQYDASDNLVSMTDAVNNTTTYAYDALNRQISMTDALNNTSYMKYDAVDNLTETTDRNNRTRQFTYDDLDRLIQEDWLLNGSFTGTHFTYDYDAVGNMLEAADNVSQLVMQYDNMNRLTQVDNAGTPGAPHVVMDYTYDIHNRMSTAKDTIEGVVGATDTFTYTLANNVNSVTQTGTGVTTKIRAYTYDFFGQITGFTDFKDTQSFANLVTTVGYGYDKLERVVQHSVNFRLSGGGGAGSQYRYRYDSADRMTFLQENLGIAPFTSNAQRFSYDDTGRLTSTDNSVASRPDEGYTYDDNGNRLSDSTHGANLVYGDGNRLESDGTYNYDYDDEGNLIKRTHIASGNYREVAFDFRNRLVMVTERNSSDVATQVTTYQYDCFDRRISKQVDSTPGDGIEAPITWFAYDGANVRLEFVDPDGSGVVPAVLTTRYFNGLGVDNIIAQENYAGSPFDLGAFWHIKNYQGSTTDIVKAADDGGFQNHITYDSYGNVQSQSNANASSRYMYTGREYDAETGLQYYRARYYDSSTGRFLSEDPISFANLYSYVGGDPVNAIDPWGWQSMTVYVRPGKASIRSKSDSGHAAYRLSNPKTGVDTGIHGFSPDFDPSASQIGGPGSYGDDSDYDFKIQAMKELSPSEFDAALKYYNDASNPYAKKQWDPRIPQQCTTEAANAAEAAGHPFGAKKERVSPFAPKQMTPRTLYNWLLKQQGSAGQQWDVQPYFPAPSTPQTPASPGGDAFEN